MNSGSNIKSWQLHLELWCEHQQKPQGRDIHCESLPPGVTHGAPTAPEKSQDRACEPTHTLCVLRTDTTTQLRQVLQGACWRNPIHPSQTAIPTPLPWLTSLWLTLAQLRGRAVNPNRERFQLKIDPRNKCMYVLNSQHDLPNYCSGVTEGRSGTVWWEQEYLMPLLLTNILDCEIMALRSLF